MNGDKYSRIVIVTYSFYDFDLNRVNIGGLETYVKDLLGISDIIDCEMTVYQLPGNANSQQVKYNGANIINYPVVKSSLMKSAYQSAFDTIFKKENDGETFFIIAAETMNIKSPYKNVATIQHGIYHDSPDEYMFANRNIKSHFLRLLYRHYKCQKEASRLFNIRNIVCVDYNYFNWFRTVNNIPEDHLVKVIPNHVSDFITKDELKEKLKAREHKKKIVFARRFVDTRGTSMFINVSKRLLEERDDVDITFAGDGPLRSHITKSLSKYSSFHLTSFDSSDSISFHKNYDISVVPSISTEGTSLSLLESMASGCFPLASHVGGMTNIILDGFNGILFYPQEESLYHSIVEVLSMTDSQFDMICENAYKSCISAFGKEKWLNSWADFILSTLNAGN